MAYLELKNLCKQYTADGAMIVDNMNLSIEKGQFITLLGPSGCGKTTTIRMISGLEDVTDGDIFIDGESILDKDPKDRQISMIFQSYALWPHMTVYENIAYPLKLRKLNKKEISTKVREAAEKSGLGELLNRYPSEMSGGQRQRVAVARSIVVNPKVFLMDEPLSNLDAKLRVVMRTELKKIHQENDATTIFVTHDQSEAMSIADEIIIMNNGLIEQKGTPNEVYSNSATRFVAEFIGNPPTNFFDAEISFIDNKLTVTTGFGNFQLEDDKYSGLSKYQDQLVDLGIRPEFMDIKPEFGSSSAEFSPVEISYVEPQGTHSILIAWLDETEVKIMTTKNMNTQPGYTGKLYVDTNNLGFFDKETGKRID